MGSVLLALLHASSGFAVLADALAPDSPLTWVQTGGLVGGLTYAVLAFMRGWVVSGKSHERTVEARDKRIETLEDENREQAVFLRDAVVPLVTRSQDVLVKIMEERAWDERRRRETQ